MSITISRRVGALLVAGAIVLGTSSLSAASSPKLVSAVDSKPLTMCTNEDGSVRNGDLDLLLLLDNSKSLNMSNGSDRDGLRYPAIQSMLASIEQGVGQTRAVNFALYSFGGKAEPEIDFGSVAFNASQLGPLIQTKVPPRYGSQSSETNYIKALDGAYQALSNRPDGNCKVLIWFTDGVHDSPEGNPSKAQAEVLKKAMCEADPGLARKFQAARINSFVLLLEPKGGGQEQRDASLSAMQAITGDASLPKTIEDKSYGCWSTEYSHLGEVVLASEAATIGSFMAQIANIAEGGRQATSECPVTLGNSSLPLPAARHLEWVTIEKLASAELPGIEDLSVKVGSTRKPAAKYLQPVPDSGNGYEQKFNFTAEGEQDLRKGWVLESTKGLTGQCLRVKAHDFVLRLKPGQKPPVEDGNENSQTVIDNDLDDLTFAAGSNLVQRFDLKRALEITGEIVAFLNIDATPAREVFGDDVVIKVLKSNEPIDTCSRTFHKEGTMNKDRVHKSEPCEVDFGGTGVADEDPLPDLDQGSAEELGKKCGAKFDVVPTSRVESKVVFILRATFESKKANCEGTLRLTWWPDGEKREIDVNFNLKPKAPLAVVVLLTLLGLAAVILANLALLNFLMRRLVKLPDANQLRAVELPVVVTRSGSSGYVMTSDGTPLSQIAVRQDDIKVVNRGEGESLAISRSNTSLRLARPGFFRPLQAAVCRVMVSPAVYSPAMGSPAGLPPVFRVAAIAHGISRSGDQSVSAMLTIFVPVVGPGAGAKGVEAMLQDVSRMRELAAGSWNAAFEESGDSTPSPTSPAQSTKNPVAPTVADNPVPTNPSGNTNGPTIPRLPRDR